MPTAVTAWDVPGRCTIGSVSNSTMPVTRHSRPVVGTCGLSRRPPRSPPSREQPPRVRPASVANTTSPSIQTRFDGERRRGMPSRSTPPADPARPRGSGTPVDPTRPELHVVSCADDWAIASPSAPTLGLDQGPTALCEPGGDSLHAHPKGGAVRPWWSPAPGTMLGLMEGETPPPPGFDVLLADGTTAHVRAITPDDAPGGERSLLTAQSGNDRAAILRTSPPDVSDRGRASSFIPTESTSWSSSPSSTT